MPVLPERPSNLKMIFHERVHEVEADLCKVAETESKERHQVCKEVHEVHKVEAELDNIRMPVLPERTSKHKMIFHQHVHKAEGNLCKVACYSTLRLLICNLPGKKWGLYICFFEYAGKNKMLSSFC